MQTARFEEIKTRGQDLAAAIVTARHDAEFAGSLVVAECRDVKERGYTKDEFALVLVQAINALRDVIHNTAHAFDEFTEGTFDEAFAEMQLMKAAERAANEGKAGK